MRRNVEESGVQMLLDVKHVAARIGVSVRNVWRLLSKKLMPKPVHLGGSTRWRTVDIDGWIDAGCPDLATFERLQDQESDR